MRKFYSSFEYGCLFITNRKEIKSTLNIVWGPLHKSTLDIASFAHLSEHHVMQAMHGGLTDVTGGAG